MCLNFKTKAKKIAKQSKVQCPCCPCLLLFYNFMADDFSEYNQIYQLLFAHSLFVSRSLRLLFFFLPLYI